VFGDALNRLALQTVYDKDKQGSDILHHVFTGPGLSTLFQQGLARISEVEDEIEDEQDSFDNVDDQNVEADRDGSVDETEHEIEDVDASYKLSAKEKQWYETFKHSNIVTPPLISSA
jgi:hypothetical protein